jgi:hypothetical protein
MTAVRNPEAALVTLLAAVILRTAQDPARQRMFLDTARDLAARLDATLPGEHQLRRMVDATLSLAEHRHGLSRHSAELEARLALAAFFEARAAEHLRPVAERGA